MQRWNASRVKPRSLVGLAAVVLLGAASAQAADLAAGSPAPPFELLGSDGRTYALSDFAGERELVLAWFPKAFTPG